MKNGKDSKRNMIAIFKHYTADHYDIKLTKIYNDNALHKQRNGRKKKLFF